MPPVLRSKSFQKALDDMADEPTAEHGRAVASEDVASVNRCLKAMHATAPPSAAPYPAPRRAVKRTSSGQAPVVAPPVHVHDDNAPVKVRSVAASMDRCAQALEHEQEGAGGWHRRGRAS